MEKKELEENTRCWACMATKHVRKSCSSSKDTQVKLDIKVAIYQLGDLQNQKPESSPPQKTSDKDKWALVAIRPFLR